MVRDMVIIWGIWTRSVRTGDRSVGRFCGQYCVAELYRDVHNWRHGSFVLRSQTVCPLKSV